MKDKYSEGLQAYVKDKIELEVHAGLIEPSDGWALIADLAGAVDFFAGEDEDDSVEELLNIWRKACIKDKRTIERLLSDADGVHAKAAYAYMTDALDIQVNADHTDTILFGE